MKRRVSLFLDTWRLQDARLSYVDDDVAASGGSKPSFIYKDYKQHEDTLSLENPRPVAASSRGRWISSQNCVVSLCSLGFLLPLLLESFFTSCVAEQFEELFLSQIRWSVYRSGRVERFLRPPSASSFEMKVQASVSLLWCGGCVQILFRVVLLTFERSWIWIISYGF